LEAWNRDQPRTFSSLAKTETDMPKRITDEKTGIAATTKAKMRRMQDEEGSRSGGVDDDAEPRGLDEDLANPELEIEGEEDEDDSISPPPLDGRFAKL
jgi:hypothetical protein